MTGRESARQALASRERSRRWPWSELAHGKAASVGGLFIPNVTYWQKRRLRSPLKPTTSERYANPAVYNICIWHLLTISEILGLYWTQTRKMSHYLKVSKGDMTVKEEYITWTITLGQLHGCIRKTWTNCLMAGICVRLRLEENTLWITTPRRLLG